MSEIVPTELESIPEEHSPFHRTISVLIGLVAVVAALNATLESDAKRHKDSQVNFSARLATRASDQIAASGIYTTFQLSSLQESIGDSLAATARLLAIFSHPTTRANETPRALAEVAASKRIQAIAKEMGAAPTEQDGVDEFTREAMTASTDEEAALVAEQNRAVGAADRYGGREERAILGLSLAASAAALLGLAGIISRGRASRILLAVAGAALLGAIAAGASGLAL